MSRDFVLLFLAFSLVRLAAGYYNELHLLLRERTNA